MPPGVAVRTAGWGKFWQKQNMGPLGPNVVMSGDSTGGVPILITTPSVNVAVVVEAAWGGNPAALPDALTWTDITSDVLVQNGISIQVGRQDESSTVNPSKCDFRLINTLGAYSRGAQSSNYPNVRRGTPIRVRVITNGVSRTRFFGNAVGFTPGWDTSGKFAYVAVTAAGAKRRIKQKNAPFTSPLRRSSPNLSGLVAYWPCEDGNQSGVISAYGANNPLNVANVKPQLANYSGFLGTLPIPTMQATESWSGSIPVYPASTSGQFRFLLSIPSNVTVPDQTPIVELSTGGTIAKVKLLFSTSSGSGGMRLIAYDLAGTSLVDTGNVGFALNGNPAQVTVQWVQSGGNITFTIAQLTANQPNGAAGYFNSTPVAKTIDAVNNFTIAPTGLLTGVAVGQITFQSIADDIFTQFGPLNAFIGELAHNRINRLCVEQGESFVFYNNPSNTSMGPQTTDTFENLIEAASAADDGFLFDSIQSAAGSLASLNFYPRSALENRDVGLALSINQLVGQFAPVDDDQQTVNSFTASRPNGAVASAQDNTSTMSVGTIGLYQRSATPQLQYDSPLLDYANWEVHKGTVDDYRYPSIAIALHANPELVTQWQATNITHRVTIDNVSTYALQQENKQIVLMIQGWTEVITNTTWDVTLNTSPGQVWDIATLFADTGDTSNTARVDTDGSQLVAIDALGTTLTVNATSQIVTLWTTAADDFPFDVNIAGARYTVTAVTNVSSTQQTFTVSTPVPPTAVGSGVTLWKPTVPSR